MPNRYDRSACATELRLRDNILDNIRRGWSPAIQYEIPAPAPPGEYSPPDNSQAYAVPPEVTHNANPLERPHPPRCDSGEDESEEESGRWTISSSYARSETDIFEHAWDSQSEIPPVK